MPFRWRPGTNAGWAAAILTLVIGGVALWRLNATLVAARNADRVETTLDSVTDILSLLKDAETSQRGYVLTGDTAYLAPYHDAIAGLRADVAALRRLAVDGPGDRARVQALEPLVGRRLAEIDTTIALRRSGGFESSVKIIRTNAGKRSMDSVRVAIGILAESQRDRLTVARQRQQKADRVGLLIIVIGTLGAFALALLAQGFVRNGAEQLRRTSAELATANAELQVKSAAADAASQAKSDFLAVMSHELRTPLNAVLGFAALLAEGIDGPVTPRQLAALSRIQSGARTLLGLVDEVLTYVHLGRGSETINRSDVDICETIRNVVALVEHVFDAKGLGLRFDEPAGDCVADTNPVQVSHILLNLLTNAAKFTATGTVVVAVRSSGRSLAIDVRDPGIGISLADQERIFEPFVQADHGRARSSEGAGLGLSTARRIARSLGGELTVASELGRGSTFTLQLPLGAKPFGADLPSALAEQTSHRLHPGD